jgi:hypothetical protein
VAIDPAAVICLATKPPQERMNTDRNDLYEFTGITEQVISNRRVFVEILQKKAQV